MKTWKSIFKGELSLVFEDKSILLTCLVAPLLYAFFVGSIYLEKEVNEIPVAVVDYDHSSLSRQVSQLINSSEKVAIQGHYSSLDDAMFHFNNLDVQGIAIIPKGFQKNTMNLDGSNIELILNNTKFLTSNDINKAVQTVILTVAGGVRMEYFVSNSIPIALAEQQAQPILPVIKPIYNATNNYGDYLLPVLLILILQQTLIIGFGESVVYEFKEGILRDLSNVNFFVFMKIFSAKSFYYVLLYMSYFFVFFKLIFPHFSLTFEGSIFIHLAVSFVYTSVVILYTILFASFFKTMVGWTEIMAFSTYPLFLVSGYTWPIEELPRGLQFFANILPSTPYFSVFNAIAKEGAKIENVVGGFVHLLVLLLLAYLLLFLRFKFLKQKRQIVSHT